MPNENDLNNLPLASVSRQKGFRISVVWIIPILAAVVAMGIAIQRIRNAGFPGGELLAAPLEAIGKAWYRLRDTV